VNTKCKVIILGLHARPYSKAIIVTDHAILIYLKLA